MQFGQEFPGPNCGSWRKQGVVGQEAAVDPGLGRLIGDFRALLLGSTSHCCSPNPLSEGFGFTWPDSRDRRMSGILSQILSETKGGR